MAPDDGSRRRRWMPGLWKAQLDGAGRERRGRSTSSPGARRWRVRAGAKDAPAAAPLRELAGDDARRVLFAVGVGVAHEQHPRGLATDGRLAVPVRGGADSGVLVVGGRRPAHDGAGRRRAGAGSLTTISSSSRSRSGTARWRRCRPPGPAGGARGPRRDARGARDASRAARVERRAAGRALAKAGCARAVVLDRGAHATGFLDRAGTSNPPRARYDESVLYALGSPLRPNGFRFDASTPSSRRGAEIAEPPGTRAPRWGPRAAGRIGCGPIRRMPLERVAASDAWGWLPPLGRALPASITRPLTARVPGTASRPRPRSDCTRRTSAAREASSAVGRRPAVARAVVCLGARLVVPGRLAGARVVDPVGPGVAHVEVHEGAVRVVPAARVAQRAQKSRSSSFGRPGCGSRAPGPSCDSSGGCTAWACRPGNR